MTVRFWMIPASDARLSDQPYFVNKTTTFLKSSGEGERRAKVHTLNLDMIDGLGLDMSGFGVEPTDLEYADEVPF